MPQIKDKFQAIRAQLHEDLRAAVGAPGMRISYGYDRLEDDTLPRAAVGLPEIAQSIGGQGGAALDVAQGIEFAVYVWLPMPSNEEDAGEDAALDVHDALALAIESSPHYAGHGHFTHISSFTPMMPPDGEHCLLLMMKVSMVTYTRWGT